MTETEQHEKEMQLMTLESDLGILQSQLASEHSDIGDWKVAKCYEYALAGLEPPYDIAELHAKRQAVRDQINVLMERKKEIEEHQ